MMLMEQCAATRFCVVQSRAYDQALMVLLHYPDLWAEYAQWHQEGGGGAAPALAVLNRGRQARAPRCRPAHQHFFSNSCSFR